MIQAHPILPPRQLVDYGADRRCAGESCISILRRTNPGPYCDPCVKGGARTEKKKVRRIAPSKRAERREQVLAMLPATAAFLAEEFDLSRDGADKMMRRLVKAGLVRREGRRGSGVGQPGVVVNGYVYHRVTDGARGEP